MTGEDMRDSRASARSGPDFAENSAARPQTMPADIESAPPLASERNLDALASDAPHPVAGGNASALQDAS